MSDAIPPALQTSGDTSQPSAQELDKSEFEGMVRGEMYLASDPYIQSVAGARRKIVRALNKLDDDEERHALARTFFDVKPDSEFFFLLPFFCEYGFNVHLGTEIFIGPNCTMLDVTSITIGNKTMLGPNVSLLTATHPVSPEERNGLKGKEYSKPIKIGDNCWLGGGVIVCPGVTIGNGVTVGAGAVVTKDVPDRVVVAGNPARIIKHIA